MAKPKSPILSFGARGTLADSLTFQKRGTGTFVRRKPTPAYRHTLLQTYQRWLYQDYVAYWHAQTTVTKQLWETNARPYHMTGFAYWMKYHLTNMPDIVAMYYLDEKGGIVAYDHSPNAYNGTIIGASPIAGAINGAQYFDGINDRIDLDAQFTLDYVTIECLALTQELPWTSYRFIFGMFDGATHCMDIQNVWPGSTLRLYIRTALGTTALNLGNAPAKNEVFHITLRYDGVTFSGFINGVLSNSVPLAGGPVSGLPKTAYIGWRPLMDWKPWLGWIDHLIIWNRALDQPTILRHSERRYPA